MPKCIHISGLVFLRTCRYHSIGDIAQRSLDRQKAGRTEGQTECNPVVPLGSGGGLTNGLVPFPMDNCIAVLTLQSEATLSQYSAKDFILCIFNKLTL